MSTQNEIRSSVRRLQLTGLLVVLTVVGGVGGWASTAQISGAVIAIGQVVVQDNMKKVQHEKGGLVGEILARNGDLVLKDQVLVRLDATVTRANLAIVEKRLTELRARRARLAAERDGADTIKFPQVLRDQRDDPAVADVMAGEQRLFELRRTTREGQKRQLALRVKQIEQVIEGLQIQATAKSKEIKFIGTELQGARKLWRKGLMPISRLTQLERESTRTDGEYGNLVASKARSREQVSETRLQLLQVDRQLAAEVASELREVEAEIGEYVERRIAANADLQRIDIRAPASGIVHESEVDTVGGVIAGGQTVMQIVPPVDDILIEARVAPPDIDQITLGQTAVLRLTAFNQRTTPEFIGRVSRLSPNITIDPRTGEQYYAVRLVLDEGQVSQAISLEQLKPGMPGEVYFKLGDRSVMSYLMKPVTDQFERAFREE